VNIKGSNTDLVVDGPGMVKLIAMAESMYGGVFPLIEGHLNIDLPLANSQYAVPVQVTFTFREAKNRWEFGDLSEEREWRLF
jgi:hypothetical protein